MQEFSVDVHSRANESELAQAWGELQASGCSTPFQNHEYAALVADSALVGPQETPIYAVVKQRSSGKATLILPMVLRTSWGVKRLEFLDYGLADYHLPVFCPETFSRAGLAEAVFKSLRAALPKHDVLVAKNAVPEFRGHANPLFRSGVNHGSTDAAHFIAFDDSPLDQLKSNHKVYKQSRRARNRLAREFGMEIVEATEPVEIDAIFDAMQAHRKDRFEVLGVRDSLADPRRLEFFRKLAQKRCPSKGALLLGAKVGDEWIATSFCMCHDGVVSGQLSSFADGPWAKYSPGNILQVREIEWTTENGFELYDFGAGDFNYKGRFGGSQRERVCVTIPNNWKGRLYVAAMEGKLALKRLGLEKLHARVTVGISNATRRLVPVNCLFVFTVG